MFKQLFFSLLFFFPLFIFAQNLIILDSLGNIVNGQTITYSGLESDSLVNLHFGVKNNFSDTLEIKMKRTEMGKVPGTQNYFCWSICYLPVFSGAKPTWTDLGSVFMKPDSVYDNFSAYFLPNGISGVAGFHYVLFDVNNPGDSSFVDIVYDISVGTEELMYRDYASSGNFDVYPNPASDNICVFLKNIGISKAEIQIANVLGEVVGKGVFSNEKGEIFSLKSLEEGIYFCSVVSAEKIVGTKKIVISR